LQVTASNLHRN